MKGRVVNKRARYNLCFSDISQEPDYENKLGRVVAYDEVPLLSKLRDGIIGLIEEKTKVDKQCDIKVEGNYYYDTKKCYIGWHGDTERRLVIGCRLGADFPLHFRWYCNSILCNDRITSINLKHGDMYIMSEYATGYNWKRKKFPTVRHSAGWCMIP